MRIKTYDDKTGKEKEYFIDEKVPVIEILACINEQLGCRLNNKNSLTKDRRRNTSVDSKVSPG